MLTAMVTEVRLPAFIHPAGNNRAACVAIVGALL